MILFSLLLFHAAGIIYEVIFKNKLMEKERITVFVIFNCINPVEMLK